MDQKDGDGDSRLPAKADDNNSKKPVNNNVDTDTPPTAAPAATQSAVTAPENNQTPSPIPSHIHATWTPKYGRIAKCDICEGRSPGCIQLCKTCLRRTICESCARDGRWKKDKKYHFIDPDACDWTVRKISKRKKKDAEETVESSSSSSPDPTEGRAARRRKRGSSAQAEANFDGEADNAGNEASGNRSSAARTSLVSASDSFSTPTDRASRRRSQPAASTLVTAASTRPNVRQAAARALEGMSQQTRRSSRVQFEQKGNMQGGGSVSDNINHLDDGETEDENEDEEKGDCDYVNNARNPSPGRRGDYALRSSRIGTRHVAPPITAASDPLVAAGLHPATPNGRERLIANIYQDIYGTRPEMDYYRVPTTIPEYWEGDWPNGMSQYQYTQQALNRWGQTLSCGMPHPLAMQEQYHHELHELHVSTARHGPNLPAPPRGYEQYFFHHQRSVSLSPPPSP